MARITIEDCSALVPNRFQLVLMARIRARQLQKGADPLVERGENKDVVTALREIAAGFVRADPPQPKTDETAR
jgi:DNA-directed RNA polymerase subunit omega